MEQKKAAAGEDVGRLQWHPAFSSALQIELAEIDPEDITITVVCGRYPRKVMHKLKAMCGVTFRLCEPGIYRVDPARHFPIQFILNTRLDPERFKWLSRLRSNLTLENDVEILAEEYREKKKSPLYETTMDIIMRANKEVYEEAKKNMCQALRELFADEWEEAEQKLKQRMEQQMEQQMEQGIEQGIEQGESRLGQLISRLLTDGRINDAQQVASDEKFRRKCYQEYGIAN